VPADPDPANTNAAARVRAFLLERGLDPYEISQAEANGMLTVLVIDQLVFPGQPRYRTEELPEVAGIEPGVAKQLWRAMGFPEVPDDETIIYDADLAALREAVADWTVAGSIDPHVARAASSAMARISEVSTDILVARVEAARAAGIPDAEMAALCLDNYHVDRIISSLAYVFRRQMRATIWRRLGQAGGPNDDRTLAVGFVDLVRFTAITERVADDELERLIVKFEDLSHQVVTGCGGRVVKMIGDAVMFVTDDAPSAVTIAAGLVEVHEADEELPPARAGLACGSVLAHDGDYFGPVVNLASRIVDVARPNSVVCSDQLHRVLASDERYAWSRLPQKKLKGIGSPPLWSLKRLPQ
jgi:adenylate cyclase